MKFMLCPLILESKEKSKQGEMGLFLLISGIFTNDKGLRFINYMMTYLQLINIFNNKQDVKS